MTGADVCKSNDSRDPGAGDKPQPDAAAVADTSTPRDARRTGERQAEINRQNDPPV